MSAPPPEKPVCIDCGALAPGPCAYCRLPICDDHVQSTRRGAELLFGPYFMPRDVRVCQLCYGERLWQAVRALLFLMAGAFTIGALVTRLWPAIPVIWGFMALWWWLGGRYVRTFRDRRSARGPLPAAPESKDVPRA